MSLKGRVENFLGYVFKNGVLRQTSTFGSNLLDANEFMTEGDTTQVQEVADTSAMKTIFIPQNIDFTLNTSLKKVLFDKMEMTNIGGGLVLRGSKAIMDKLHMDLFNGSMMVSVFTILPILPEAADPISISTSRTSRHSNGNKVVQHARKDGAYHQKLQGNISLKFTFKTAIGKQMSPVLNSIDGYSKVCNRITFKL